MAEQLKATADERRQLGAAFDAEVQKQFGDDREVLDEYRRLEWCADLRRALPSVRKHAKLSQKQLAKLIGTDQGEISRLEKIAREGVSLDRIRRFVEACGGRLALTVWDREGQVVLDQAQRMVEREELSPEARDAARGLDRLADLVSRDDEFSERVARKVVKLSER
jgi:transcriptional regulator with XRE-family HTH domain